MAGYCNWPVEVDRRDFFKMQERVGNVFFAGDATDGPALGFVEGALNSGRREALKVLACISGGECLEYVPKGPRPGKGRKNCNVAKCEQ